MTYITNKPFILSIIIPVYNVESFIEDCLDSVLNFNGRRSIEMIIVNDCSTDDSRKIIEKKIFNLSSITLINNESNQGLSISRNIGIKHAEGEFIVFLDSDDLLNTNEVYNLVEYAILNDLDLIEFQYIRFKYNLEVKNYFATYQQNINGNFLDGKTALLQLFESNSYKPVVWNKIYKSDLIKENNLVFFKSRLSEDIHWTPRVYSVAKKVLLTGRLGYFYRSSPTSLTNSKDPKIIDKMQSDIIYLSLLNIDYFKYESNLLRNEIYDWTSRSIMFAATLNPTNYNYSRFLPLRNSKKIPTIIKSIIFALSVNLFAYLKKVKDNYVKN